MVVEEKQAYSMCEDDASATIGRCGEYSLTHDGRCGP